MLLVRGRKLRIPEAVTIFGRRFVLQRAVWKASETMNLDQIVAKIAETKQKAQDAQTRVSNLQGGGIDLTLLATLLADVGAVLDAIAPATA